MELSASLLHDALQLEEYDTFPVDGVLHQGGICGERGGGVNALVTDRGMALNGLFCADVLRPLTSRTSASLTLSPCLHLRYICLSIYLSIYLKSRD